MHTGHQTSYIAVEGRRGSPMYGRYSYNNEFFVFL